MRRSTRNTWIALASLGLFGIPSLGTAEHEPGPRSRTKAGTAPASEATQPGALPLRPAVEQAKQARVPASRVPREAAVPEHARPMVVRRYPYDPRWPRWHHWPYRPHPHWHPYWGHRHPFHPDDPWYRPWSLPHPSEVVVPADKVLVEVNVDPGKADVIVDGGLVGDARDLDSPAEALWLDAGEHTVVLAAPGYRTLRLRVDLQGGRRYDLRYDLQEGSGLDPRSSAA